MSEDIVVDFSKVEEQDAPSFDPIPRGMYECEVDETTFSFTNTEPPKPMITMRMVVLGGEYEDRKLWDRLILSEKGAPYLKKKLRVLLGEKRLAKMKKVNSETFEELSESGELIGKTVIAKVKIKKYNGEARNVIEALYSPDEISVQQEEFV